MTTAYSTCPRCHIEWGIHKVAEAQAAQGNEPAKPAQWACDACLHRWKEAT